MLAMTLGLAKIQLRSHSCPSAEAVLLWGQVPKLAALAAGLEATAQQLAYCQHNTSATNCSRLPPLLPVKKMCMLLAVKVFGSRWMLRWLWA